MPLWWPLLVAALLFAIGVYGVLARRNAVLVLMGVELMLNAVNLNLVAFDARLHDALHAGQTFALFVIVDRRGRDRAGAGDRAAGVPHPRAHRRGRPARARRPRPGRVVRRDRPDRSRLRSEVRW